jgi:hypothetical protein
MPAALRTASSDSFSTPLSEHLNIQRSSDADDARNDSLLGATEVDVAQQLHVDFDQIWLQARQ